MRTILGEKRLEPQRPPPDLVARELRARADVIEVRLDPRCGLFAVLAPEFTMGALGAIERVLGGVLYTGSQSSGEKRSTVHPDLLFRFHHSTLVNSCGIV